MDLQKIELFSSLNSSEISQVNSIARRIHLTRGEAVFNEGDYEKNIYIVETGQVEIFKRTPLSGEQSISVMKNGDYFGEMAFFEKAATRSASARTLQTTSLIVIEGPDFEKLIHNYPSISLKLLATLSQRLRDTTRQVVTGSGPVITGQKKECQLITVASAKDGYGKTTFATSLCRILSVELNKKVLFLDLDLYFGGGTHLLGVHSPRSIVDITNKFRADEQKFNLLGESIRLSENLFTIPAPRSFLEAEQIHATDIIKLLKEAKKYYDYVVTDTGSIFDENLYTVLDTSDFVFFIINFASLSTITDNVRFFHGISKLSYPRERLILLGNNIGSDFSTSKTSRVFPYPVIGGLPKIADFEPQFGKPAYDVNPTSPYCEVLRLLVRNVLKEVNLKKPQTKGGIFSMLFGERDPEQVINLQLSQLHPPDGSSFSPIINPRDVRSQVKYVRYNLLFGYIEEAKSNLLSFMEYSQTSAPLCELLGEIFLIEEKLSEALEAFQKAVALDDQQHVAMGYLSFLSGSKESFDRAISAVEAKIAANPNHLDLINDYGKILMINEHYEEAAIQFKKALKSNPNYLEAKINLATSLAKIGKSEDAIEMLIGVENKNPRLFFTLGEIFYQSGRLYLAYKAYNKASILYPAYPGLRPRLFELAGYLRKLDTVIDLHEKFVNTSPKFPDLHTKLANFYHLAGKSELAITQFKKALAINPNYKEAKIKLESLQKDSIWRLAKQHLEDATDVNAATRALKAVVNFISGDEKVRFPAEAVLHIKNVGSSKTIQKAINAAQLESGTAELDLSPLGLLANQDILLFQIAEAKTGNIIRFAPHYLEKEEILTGRCVVDLDFDLNQETDGLIEHLTKYFLVHLESKKYSGLITTNGSAGYKALLRNESNGLEASGYINPENDTQINFVLNASGKASMAAVNPGDRLNIKIVDAKKDVAFATDFTIAKADVLNFCKTVVAQENGKTKEAS